MTDAENNERWQAYFFPNTQVLRNNLGIYEPEALKEAEATISFEKLLELSERPLDLNFDKHHLLELHKYIFGEIYPFAGKYRNVNMRKERGSFLFVNDEHTIDEYLDMIFNQVKERLMHCHSKYDFAETLAYIYTNLIYCHPFREGNGRTIREFVREFSLAKSQELGMEQLELDWCLVNKAELNQYIEVAHMFPSATALLFNSALVTKNKTK